MTRAAHRWMTGAAALLLLPTVGMAQLVTSTGIDLTAGKDNRWSISSNGGAFVAATKITTPPGVWATPTASFAWIGTTASGTGGTSPYAARTQFMLGAGDLFSLTLRCAVDNNPLGVFVNSVLVAGAGCSTFAFGSSFTLSSWLQGTNTLEFRWSGDNTTDGLAVLVESQRFTPGTPGTPNVVPEPSTYALLLSGLGLLALARRRRNLV